MAARRRSTGSEPCLDRNNDIGRQHNTDSIVQAETKAKRESEKTEESAIILNHWYLFGVALNTTETNHK